MRIFKLLCLFLLLVGLCTTGCEKRVRGPQGPEGPTGEKGPVGPEGDRGPTGDDGTVDSISVYTSDWAHAEDWKDSAGLRYGVILAPQLTQEVIENDLVLAYYRYQDLYIYKLPFKGTYTSPHTIKYILKPGKIILETTYDLAHAKENEYFRYSIMLLK